MRMEKIACSGRVGGNLGRKHKGSLASLEGGEGRGCQDHWWHMSREVPPVLELYCTGWVHKHPPLYPLLHQSTPQKPPMGDTTLVHVSNLSRNVRHGHLEEIFGSWSSSNFTAVLLYLTSAPWSFGVIDLSVFRPPCLQYMLPCQPCLYFFTFLSFHFFLPSTTTHSTP